MFSQSDLTEEFDGSLRDVRDSLSSIQYSQLESPALLRFTPTGSEPEADSVQIQAIFFAVAAPIASHPQYDPLVIAACLPHGYVVLSNSEFLEFQKSIALPQFFNFHPTDELLHHQHFTAAEPVKFYESLSNCLNSISESYRNMREKEIEKKIQEMLSRQ